MRMRKKKNAPGRLAACGALWAQRPFENKGAWQRIFANDRPIHIELGSGKGRFIAQLARENPQVNYVAIEKLIDTLAPAAELGATADISNLRYVLGDAAMLCELFAPGEVSRIYINFCDPWHKARHAKRRMTHESFLRLYETVLAPGGDIHFKTDNRLLFEFSLNSFCDNGFRLKNITLDLHHSKFEGNIMTEYEKKFHEAGMPIYRLEASCLAKK